jgi:glycerol dehydrogenase
MLKVFCSPSRYTQGSNSTFSLGKEMATLGLAGPAFIVAGKTAIAVLSDTWRLSLENAGFAYQVYRFGGECSIAEIERVKRQARDQGARVIIGAGGGKVLDTARAAAADLDLPVVSCPTVASSDAPCSRSLGHLHRRGCFSAISDIRQESGPGARRYPSHCPESPQTAGSRHGRRARHLV